MTDATAPPLCAAAGCPRAAARGAYCHEDYRREHYGTCVIDGCAQAARATHGFCGTHAPRGGRPSTSPRGAPRTTYLTDKGRLALGLPLYREVPVICVRWRPDWKDRRDA